MPDELPDDVVNLMSEVSAPSTFFKRTYDEAFSLLVEARNYIAYCCGDDMNQLENDGRLLVSQETMRITCRMTQVMAWLFCQRAMHDGEISRERALSEEFALGGERVCLDDRWTDDERLPPAVRSLLDRSLRLYQRIRRLDGMLRQNAA